ncbi:hypothetical protein PybrP1_010379 [[Pythium] brassicae (nom. inval.)]|nr:hypothetical protein PybrP1_010379 [[Pythium] brassicae (nom. inval.)]
MEAAGVSDGMRALLDGYKKLHETVLRLQTQIEEEEAAYLEETPHGNIIRGWDGFIDAKPPRKDATTKKTKPYSDAEHLFSGCCAYASLASEPSLDLVDPTVVDEAGGSGRRKLSTAGGSVATANGAFTGGSKLQRTSSMSERKASLGAAPGKGTLAASGGGGSAGGAAGKASKLKKRRRELQSEGQESAELDTASPAASQETGSAEKDFLDVF